MKLKPGVMERAKQTNNVRFVQLLGPQAICEFNRFKYLDVKNAVTFHKAFGEETKCFYVLEQYTAKAVIYYERGIGYVTNGPSGETYLVRENPVCFGKNCNNLRPMGNKLPIISESKDSVLIASSVFPVSYLEALLSPHSVLTSTDSLPEVTYIPNNCVLGRLENNIEAISLDLLAEKVAEILRDVSPKFAPLEQDQVQI